MGEHGRFVRRLFRFRRRRFVSCVSFSSVRVNGRRLRLRDTFEPGAIRRDGATDARVPEARAHRLQRGARDALAPGREDLRGARRRARSPERGRHLGRGPHRDRHEGRARQRAPPHRRSQRFQRREPNAGDHGGDVARRRGGPAGTRERRRVVDPTRRAAQSPRLQMGGGFVGTVGRGCRGARVASRIGRRDRR